MNFDAYHTIAGIGVALTGFIGIIVVLQFRDKAFSRLALFSILSTSLAAVLFPFIPELLMRPFGAEAAWRLACGVFGWYHLFLLVNHQARQRQFRKNTPIQATVTLASFPVIFLKIGVGFGYLLSYAYEIYFLGLLWCIFIPAYLFSMLILEDAS